jgi:hypothetical protein
MRKYMTTAAAGELMHCRAENVGRFGVRTELVELTGGGTMAIANADDVVTAEAMQTLKQIGRDLPDVQRIAAAVWGAK